MAQRIVGNTSGNIAEVSAAGGIITTSDLTNEALPVASASLTSTGNLFSVDTTGFNSLAVQITSAGTTCTITYECSSDNTNWVGVAGVIANNTGSLAPVLTSTTASIWEFPCVARYFRARVSTYTSGTVTGLATLRHGVLPPTGVFATLSGSAALTKTTVTANATTPSRIQSLATTNATNLKASAAVVGAIFVQNNGAALAYIKLYNKASAPTVGTDTPLFTVMIPIGGEVHVAPPAGVAFGTGLGYAITALATDADTTAVAANQVTGFIGWA